MPPISDHTTEWVEEFLEGRNLERPDGRALYAYQCSHEEYQSLASLLVRMPTVTRATSVPIRAFVLYASEWWQREYDGGSWAWEPLLKSIGWEDIHYPDLYGPVSRAWNWWKVDLVRLPTSIRYLGTFACQGGLPLALVSDAHSSVTRYLRAVLKHVDAYRPFVEDPIVLAQDKQLLLRPPTLRRDYVFRLAADLIEAVLELRDDANTDDPLEALDETRPDWRRNMPLELEDESARNLLTGLLREAAQSQSAPRDEFRVERFLRLTGTGWRMGARLKLPASVSSELLARQLGVRLDELQPRLQVRTSGEAMRVVGLYASQGDDYLLLRDSRSMVELWDGEAAAEIRLELLAGSPVGHPVLPIHGSALGDLPWVFRGMDDFLFVGEGSVASRSPDLLVLPPDGSTPSQGELITPPGFGEQEQLRDGSAGVRILGRQLWAISEETILATENGRCVLRPGSGDAGDEEYRLSGERFYGFESAWPLFRSPPRLRLARAGQPARAVPTSEVSWRQGAGEWKPSPNGFGLWTVRHLRAGELCHIGRCGILPGRFALSIEPGSDMSYGDVILSDAAGMMVACAESEVATTVEKSGHTLTARLTSRDSDNPPPATVRLRLHWAGAQELTVTTRFPGQGGRFLRDGKAVEGNLAVDDLYGLRAIALTPDHTQEFWLDGELRASDAESLLRVAHFRQRLRRLGPTHELSLVELRSVIELLLSASSSSDAYIEMKIVDGSQKTHNRTQVGRFSAVVECDPNDGLIWLTPTPDDTTSPRLQAIPLARPADPPATIGDLAHCAALPRYVDLREPWLLVVRRDEKVHARPIRLGGSAHGCGDSTFEPGSALSLAQALAIGDSHSRHHALSVAMDRLLANDTASLNEDDWSFLNDSLLRAEDLPANTFDLLRVLVTKPRLLIRSLFALESAPRELLWRLDDELPFSWLLARRDIWWTEARRAFVQQCEQLAGIIEGHHQIAQEYVVSILSEGSEHHPALETISTDCALRLEGGGLSSEFVNTVQYEREDRTPEMIRLRSNLDDWPDGYGRKEWVSELGEIPSGLWQRPDEHRARQPIFDTPVVAAWCCFVPDPTERAAFFVKRIRAHDPEWFDMSYSASWYLLAHHQDNLSR